MTGRNLWMIAAGLALIALGLAGWMVWQNRADQPVEYTVVRGDTLFEIARAHGVSVEDLREWNALEGDLIEVDQVLAIWPGQQPPAVSPGRGAGTRNAGSPAVLAQELDAQAELVLPPEQPCLEGPQIEADGEEASFAASTGLSAAAIDAAMDGFVPHTARCVDEEIPRGSLLLSMRVACTGRVAEVSIARDPGWDPEITACVQEVLRYVPFPPHALPDGEVFDYPLRFR